MGNRVPFLIAIEISAFISKIKHIKQNESMNLAIAIVQTVLRSLLSILLLGTSARFFMNTYTAVTQEKRAILQVTDSIAVSNGHGQIKNYPIVILDIPNPRSTSVSGLYGNEQYTKGDYILVRYNPETPTKIRVDSWISNAMLWVFPVASGLFGLLLIPTVKQFKNNLK
jgi:hypothetical protein